MPSLVILLDSIPKIMVATTDLFVCFSSLSILAVLLNSLWTRIKAYLAAGPNCSIIAVDPSHPTGFLWPNPIPGKIGTISEKFRPYLTAGRLMLSAVSLVTPRTILFVADPEVIKQICFDRSGVFEKDPQTYSALHVYGHNIVGSNGALWKKQREISKSAFNEGNVHLVWKESCKVSREALLLLRDIKQPIDVTVFLRKLSLASTSASVFGQRIPYGQIPSAPIPKGFTLQFGEALKTASEHMITRWAVPDFAYKLPIPPLQRFLSQLSLSFSELRKHLAYLIDGYKEAILRGEQNTGAQDDLLRRLVESNLLEKDEQKRLTDEEVLSNAFIFLIAGSETTAHTMAFVLAHLALYPDIQEKAYQEVRNIWTRDEDVENAEGSFQDWTKFEYSLAVFRESLRHFPVAPRLPKVAQKDTVLCSQARSQSGEFSETLSVAVPKDSLVVMDILGANFNPAYWGYDSLEFRPERFIDTPNYRWPREAFLAFSLGVRSCIGQRAGQVQSICILAHILRYYKVTLPPHLIGLPFEEQKSKLLRFWLGSSLTPTDIRLAFSRREETV